jgi:hypothetical protein
MYGKLRACIAACVERVLDAPCSSNPGGGPSSFNRRVGPRNGTVNGVAPRTPVGAPYLDVEIVRGCLAVTGTRLVGILSP